MLRTMIAVTATAVLLIPTSGSTHPSNEAMAPEGCEAMNPAQSTCTFTVMEDMEGPVAGVAGQGSWLVKVKRGKKTEKIKSPSSGEPTAVEYLFQAGDVVTAKALSPGSALIVGGD
ncbi:MAG: hypothetical protein ACRDLB_06550 [Actinomycetota bacterium]